MSKKNLTFNLNYFNNNTMHIVFIIYRSNLKNYFTFVVKKLLITISSLFLSLVLKLKIIYLPGLRYAQHTWGVFSFYKGGVYE